MAIIKSYTDLEQSSKLAKILPLESADMFYNEEPEDETYPKDIVDTEYPIVIREVHKHCLEEYGIPCWSLAALLDVLSNENMLVKTADGVYYCLAKDVTTKHHNNPIDACYEMILKFHRLNWL